MKNCKDCAHMMACKRWHIVSDTDKTCEDFLPLSVLADVKNELCYLCGKYRSAHLGLCDGCKFKTIEFRRSDSDL